MKRHGAESMEHVAKQKTGSGLSALCPMRSAGFTYIALLAAIVIIGISLGAAGKYWQNVMLREREEELLFRGDQYREAIRKYYVARPGVQMLPQSLDDLVKDDRFPQAKRHLRQKYKDPISGEDFVEIRDKLKGNRIVGVHSPSEKKPLKQGNFPDLYKDFENKEMYSDWKFLFTLQGAPPVTGGTTGKKPGQTVH
jgi:type II secretory pathway pseudopilin PulG